MIWQYQDRSAIVDSARHLRKRVLDNIPAEERASNLKLGRGGLRDVEFTAQLLQLVHGVGDESLHVMDTLSALEALSDAGLLSRADKSKLAAHYRFLRALEHRIQLQKLRRSHLIPSREEEFRRVARGLGLSAAELTARSRVSARRLPSFTTRCSIVHYWLPQLLLLPERSPLVPRMLSEDLWHLDS